MKFTNVKQLIIKFMGGGLINFPTRFLRWVKINGDSDDSDDGGSGDNDSDDNNILILNQQEYANMNTIANSYNIYTTEDIDYESEEDLTITIYELTELEINDIINNINEVGYIPIRIGGSVKNMLIIDKFEDLNNHYENDGDMLQDVKIHIRKAAAILPIIIGGVR